MRKRIFCALWMAFFANVPAFPLWIFWLSNGAKAPLESFSIVLVLAFAGAVVGGLIQPLAIGRRSNVIYATLMGALCAALAVPLLGVSVMLIEHPPSFTNLDGLFYFAQRTSRGLLKINGYIWLIVMPVGAIGGLTLQWAWTCRENTRPGGPCHGSHPGRSGDPYIEGE